MLVKFENVVLDICEYEEILFYLYKVFMCFENFFFVFEGYGVVKFLICNYLVYILFKIWKKFKYEILY